jgi:hypothetical protein
MYIKGLGGQLLEIPIDESDFSIFGHGKSYHDVVMNSVKHLSKLTPSLGALQQEYFKGYREGFLEPDIVLFEKGNLTPAVSGTKISDIYNYKPLLEKTYQVAHKHLSSIDSQFMDQRERKYFKKINKLKPGEYLSTTENRDLISWYMMSNQQDSLTPMTLTDNFVLASRKNMEQLRSRNGEHGIKKNIIDLRKNPIPREHFDQYSDHYDLSELLTLPEFLPTTKEITGVDNLVLVDK